MLSLLGRVDVSVSQLFGQSKRRKKSLPAVASSSVPLAVDDLNEGRTRQQYDLAVPFDIYANSDRGSGSEDDDDDEEEEEEEEVWEASSVDTVKRMSLNGFHDNSRAANNKEATEERIISEDNIKNIANERIDSEDKKSVQITAMSGDRIKDAISHSSFVGKFVKDTQSKSRVIVPASKSYDHARATNLSFKTRKESRRVQLVEEV